MHTKKPHITIGLIARNEEKHILSTLSYLVRQDYPKENIEIIIVDGNSSDSTREIATRYLEESKITHSVINEADEPADKNGSHFGHSFARNIVIKYMSPDSRYLAWIDADCRADESWLSSLVTTMEECSNDAIAGAGGRRIVETEGDDISKKELMLNYYFTSKIMSLGNPAFTDSDVVYMPSIAGYNSIYRADIIKEYGYNTLYPFNTDDIEINYRLTQDRYRFLHARKAKIYHRMDPSILVFLKQMIRYGAGAMNTSKLHKKIVRLYIPIGICYFLYILSLPIGAYLSRSYFGSAVYSLAPLVCACIISIAVIIENYHRTRSLQSLHVFYITLIHPFLYGYGAIRSFLSR